MAFDLWFCWLACHLKIPFPLSVQFALFSPYLYHSCHAAMITMITVCEKCFRLLEAATASDTASHSLPMNNMLLLPLFQKLATCKKSYRADAKTRSNCLPDSLMLHHSTKKCFIFVLARKKIFWKCIALLNGRPKGIDYHQTEEVCAVWSTCVFWKLEDTSQEIQDSNVSKIWVVVGLGGSPGEGKNFQPVGIWKHAPVNSIAAFWPGISLFR